MSRCRWWNKDSKRLCHDLADIPYTYTYTHSTRIRVKQKADEITLCNVCHNCSAAEFATTLAKLRLHLQVASNRSRMELKADKQTCLPQDNVLQQAFAASTLKATKQCMLTIKSFKTLKQVDYTHCYVAEQPMSNWQSTNSNQQPENLTAPTTQPDL